MHNNPLNKISVEKKFESDKKNKAID